MNRFGEAPHELTHRAFVTVSNELSNQKPYPTLDSQGLANHRPALYGTSCLPVTDNRQFLRATERLEEAGASILRAPGSALQRPDSLLLNH